MSKQIHPINASDNRAIGIVQDPVQPSPIRQAHYVDDWFGASGTDQPVVVNFNEPMYVAIFRTQYNSPYETFAVDGNGVLLSAQYVYAEAYDVNGNLLGTRRASEGQLGSDMGFYTMVGGQPDLQLESQNLLGVSNYISKILLYSSTSYLTSFIFLAGTTKTANDQARQTVQEYLDYIAQKTAQQEQEKQTLITELQNHYDTTYLQQQNLAGLKRLKAIIDFQSSTDLSKLPPDQAQKAFSDAVKQIDSQLTSEKFFNGIIDGFTPTNVGSGAFLRDPSGESKPTTGTGSSSSGTVVIPKATVPGGPSLTESFKNIFDPNDPQLQKIQTDYAAAVQDYVAQRTDIVNSPGSALVSEIRLIRLLLEKIIGA